MSPGDRQRRQRPQRTRRERRAGQGRSLARQPAEIWTRPEPGARRAAYSRQQIAATAIAIADAEGFDAVSMRRVATELGAGTMTLYHYVRNKDELIALIDDAIMGEIVIPAEELPDGWRAGLMEIATRTRDVFLDHPWSFEIPIGTEGGPNGSRHFEQSLEVASRTGLDRLEQLELISLIDDFVFGFALRVNEIRKHAKGDAREAAEQWSETLLEHVAVLDSDEYPHVAAMFTGRDPVDALVELIENALGPGRFDRGLELILDGIDRRIQRAAG